MKLVNVNINDLRKALPEQAKHILEDAFDEIVAIQRALKEYVGVIDPWDPSTPLMLKKLQTSSLALKQSSSDRLNNAWESVFR